MCAVDVIDDFNTSGDYDDLEKDLNKAKVSLKIASREPNLASPRSNIAQTVSRKLN